MISGRKEVADQEKQWLESGYLNILQKLFPHGQSESEHFRISASGDSGRRIAFNYETGVWIDFADEDMKFSGICELMYYIEGWHGLRRLANTFELRFDWVVLNGIKPPADEVHRFAARKKRMVAGQWEYKDFDGFYLGTRVRFENDKGEKEFRLLAFRTRKLAKVNGEDRIFQEGFRYDGAWSGIDPLYATENLLSSKKSIIICEGEKATEAARRLLGSEYECITWGSGSAGSPRKAFWQPIIDRQVIIWPDKDEPGRKAANKLAGILKNTRIVQVWDEDRLMNGDDLYDVGNSESEVEWIKKLIQDAPAGLAALGQAIKGQYVYVTQLELFFDVNTGLSSSPQSLRRAHMAELEDLDHELLTDPAFKKVTQTTYYPGQPLFLMEEDPGTGVFTERYNMWRDTGCESREGIPTVFLNHLDNLIPDKTIRDEVLDYLSFCVQHPGEKVSFCPLITGEQGIGKSYLLQVMKCVLGINHVTEVTTENLSSDFNTWAENSSMIFVEEIMASGKREMTNRMKTYLTSPTLMINGKGINLRKITNRVNFMLFSNEFTPLFLEKDDRRFLVYRSPMRRKPEQYYENLFDSLQGGEKHQIRHYLENRDISEFNPSKPAIMTETKMAMIASSESSAYLALRLAIQSKRHPFTGDVAEMIEVYEWASDSRLIRGYDKAPERILQVAQSMGHYLTTNAEGIETLVFRNHSMYQN